MPIDVDTTEAPALIRLRYYGQMPTPDEQRALRRDLVSQGLLGEGSACLLDVREVEIPDAMTIATSIADLVRADLPVRRAYIINPGKHLPLLQQFKKAAPWLTSAAFLDEREALEWLLNPEGAAGFKR